MRKSFISLLFLFAFWPSAGFSALADGVTSGPQIEGISEFTLKNGLTVLLAPDPGKATITVNITYKVGSRNENYGETGMAHLLEHLMFKGTPNHPNIADGLTRHGMRPNGTTWYDRTNYYETFSATEENLTWALEMEADRMIHSRIARSDLDSEMTVVRNEMERGENSPSSMLSEKTIAAAFLWHNYGKSTIGARADVENVGIDRLQAFYRTWYQPDNAVLVVAGKFDPDRVLNQIQQLFAPIPKPDRVLPKTYTLDPVQDGERLVVMRRPGDQQHLDVVYHAVPAGSPDFPAFEILATLLGDVPSGRLHKALTEKNLAVGTGAEIYPLLEPGFLECGVDLKLDQSLDQAEAALLKTLEGIEQSPITDDEVNRARTVLLTHIDQTFADPERFGIALSGAIAGGDWRLFFLHREALKKVSAADVQRVATSYLRPSNRTLGRFVPEDHNPRAPAPQLADVQTQLKSLKLDSKVSAGESFEPTPDNIEAHLTRSQLSPGLKLAVLPKKNRGETVHAQINLHWGTASSLFNLGTVGQFAGGLITRGGAGLDRAAIRDRFDQWHAKVGISGGATGISVSIDTTRPNLKNVLELVIQLLKTPSYPEPEFSLLQKETLAGLEEGRKDPQSLAMRAIGLHFNRYPKGDIRFNGTIEDDTDELQSVTRAQIIDFHRRFFSATHGEIVVIGDFEPPLIEGVLKEHLATWQNSEPYEKVLDDLDEAKPVAIQIETPDKANAFFYSRMGLKIRDDDPEAPYLTLANYILGEGFLNSRLATRIRQKEGLSYGVGSFLHLNRDNQTSEFGAYAIYAPENKEKLKVAFQEELQRVLKEGFSEEEVKAAAKALLQSRLVGRAQDAGLSGLIADYMRLGRTLAFSKANDAAIEGATPEKLNNAFRHFIHPEELASVFAGDFGKKSP